MLLTLKYRVIHKICSDELWDPGSHKSQVMHMSRVQNYLKTGILRYFNILKGINMVEINYKAKYDYPR